MQEEVVKVLDAYVEKYTGDLISKLKFLQTEGWNLLAQYDNLKLVNEDPEFHGEVSCLTHSLEVVNLLQKLFNFLFFQEKSEKIEIELLQKAVSVLPVPIDRHLNSVIGKKTRKELLFFACMFHDIGKLHNFVDMMPEVKEKNIKGIARFISHADYGKFYFDTELDNINEAIKSNEQKLAKEKDDVKKQFFQRALSYLTNLKNEFESRNEFFKKIELEEEERNYIAFLIGSHMDMLNFYVQFQTAYSHKNDNEGSEAMKTLIKNLLKKLDVYKSLYIDCILLNFCDNLESVLSSNREQTSLYLFLQTCFLVYLNGDGLHAGGTIVFKDNFMVFEPGKPVIKYNMGALFTKFSKPEAIKIKDIITKSADPKSALKEAGYDGDMIMGLISQ